MATTLTYSGTTVTLPEDLLWVDEFGWQPVALNREYSITGALIVQSAAKQAGRPITLQGGEDFGWINYSDLEQLRAWQALAGIVLELVFRGVTHNVMFAQESAALEAHPVVEYTDTPVATDPYVLTLRLFKV